MVGAVVIAPSPNVLIADEPATSLDATIQLQYLRRFKDIQAMTGSAIICITHDFGIAARMYDRVAVMYAGKIVEQAGVEQLFDRPAHPNSDSLLQSVPALYILPYISCPISRANYHLWTTSLPGAPSRPGVATPSTSARISPRVFHATTRLLIQA